MASNPQRKINEWNARMKKALERLKSIQSMRHFGQFASDLIVKRTRLGYGVDRNGGDRFELPPFSEVYQKFRNRVASGNKELAKALRGGSKRRQVTGFLKSRTIRVDVTRPRSTSRRTIVQVDPYFRVRKPNNTLTGEMLRSHGIRYVEPGLVKIGPSDQKHKGGDATNAEIAGYLHEKGRGFNRLSAPEIKQLSNEFKKHLRKVLADLLTK